MRIGLTYDLREDYLREGWSPEHTAEFDHPETIEAIESALDALGHRPDRIGRARCLVERLATGDRWDLVFNIAEGLRGPGREAQVPAILDVYGIPYTFSDPVVMGLTLDKALTKRVLRDLALPTADFAMVREADDACAVDLPFPVFAKPVGEGTGVGVGAASLARGQAQLEAVCRDLLRRFAQPVLVEAYLPGRELTVGLVGTGARATAVGALEVMTRPGAEPGMHSYFNKDRCEELVDYRLVNDTPAADACRLALAAWRWLGCRDAGRVDLRADSTGRFCILELNPLAGLHPTHSDLPILWSRTGGRYVDLIDAIVESAATRCRGASRLPRELHQGLLG